MTETVRLFGSYMKKAPVKRFLEKKSCYCPHYQKIFTVSEYGLSGISNIRLGPHEIKPLDSIFKSSN